MAISQLFGREWSNFSDPEGIRFKTFELVLDRDRVTPIRVVVKESETDSVRIRFAKVRLNVPVDAATMRPPSR